MNERIYQVRQALGLTMEDFGSRLRITRGGVSNVEKGRSNPSEQLILAICREFGVDEHWLRTGEGQMMSAIDEDQEFLDIAAKISVSNDKRERRIRNLLRAYWDLPEEVKKAIDQLIDSMTE